MFRTPQDPVDLFYETLEIFNDQRYTTPMGQKVSCRLSPELRSQARVYLPEDVEQVRRAYKPKGVCYRSCGCVNTDSFHSARNLVEYNEHYSFRPNKMRILVLNMANPVQPGGGVFHGAKAQEEDLCRKSSLLYSLTSKEAAPYYQYHREQNNPLSSNALILSPRVEIIRDENGFLLEEPVIVSVLSCAAPNIRYGLQNLSQQEFQELLYSRIRGMLVCAAFWGYELLTLGAFGCGAFGNDAALVAPMFKKALDEVQGNFDYVEFAVLDKSEQQYNYKQFHKIFG